jgi:uncharacterized protein (DUF488 family)
MTTVCTIGHSNHQFDTFVRLLQGADVGLVLDVRSRPRSGYVPHFNGPELRDALSKRGIDYVFMGNALGGMPDDPRFYDAEGFVLYSGIAETDTFRAGIDRLLDLASQGTLAVMCGEEDPTGCHRRLLIGRVLRERGVDVRHIRGDGRIQTEDDLLAAEASMAGPPTLFDLEEEKPWRSVRPVSSRRPPRSPSDS